ncbi:enoyl-CoA hydratase/isomerase family protein [Psychrobium sp. 1_MG-2023]|uniref:enoyl-CoA hydratase/isomerase family protein n=1 Tax=Psychrobium sp. 1_MG-2023 TaxID=3062624 RepID=UPI000C336BF8|nr:enoyl-CoA hydratase/isomerase family protein [Psychrobium sp. 1_MG-2023]MDP2561260.1 enoyl-CoA hydratase/isomerase family protein [Psychrobium sp. 1_MG-2023]PKF55312.1 enoyl-CoA hydratase [Alteromonadales bacterium alter-6D02]
MAAIDAVLYQYHPTQDGKQIVQATLNSEKSLNALSQPMVESLLTHLSQWQDNPEIVAIVLEGAGDKAFCAGGDIVQLYQAMVENPQAKQPYVEEFFTHEYHLDYLIHTYPKPIILWGNGFVMGGGLGLMAGASHRIVTETSKVAMPEISIGLYPDVGATYFLNKMPDRLGLFLGLTAAQMNAADCMEVGLADHFLPHQCKGEFLSQLTETSWPTSHDEIEAQVTALIQTVGESKQGLCPAGNIAQHRDIINQVLKPESLSDVVDAILALDNQDKWLSKAQRSLANGSAVSACILERQLSVGAELTLEECFKLELSLSVRCGQLGEFSEGVRALLIDRDNQPKWLYQQVNDVDSQVIDDLFRPMWADLEHPLSSLL